MSSGQAVFLVGGRGSRLGDLTNNTPKPLLPVAGRPFIEHLLDKAVREGFNDLILLAGYRHELVEAYAGQWRGVSVRVSVEPEPLDTAGAIANAVPLLDEQFLVVNGDTWFDFDWSQLQLMDPYDGVIAACRVTPADRYETLSIQSGRLLQFVPRHAAAEGLINGGVYRLKREPFERMAGRRSLERDVFPNACADGRLGATVFDGPFIDIGLPESLIAAGSILPMQR